jgi:hypothetical protein
MSSPANALLDHARTSYGAIKNVNSNLIEWSEVDGQPGNFIKVLSLDTLSLSFFGQYLKR